MAAPTVSVDGPAAVPWGTDVAVAGSTDTVAPLPGATVRLEVLAFPFDGAWVTGATLAADATGSFRGRVPVARNSRIRAVVAGPAGDSATPEVSVLALPRPVAGSVRRSGRSMVRRVE
jgi:hypothetical protein